MTSNSKPLADVLGSLATARGLPSQKQAAASAGVSQAYYNQVSNGRKLPSADWLNCVADAWALSDDERTALHRAGAVAHGFEIDLSGPVKMSESKKREK